jgi:hypothetical protein
MVRTLFLLLCVVVAQACIELPNRNANTPSGADASDTFRSSLDAGAQRPGIAPPFTGPECDSPGGNGVSSGALDGGEATGLAGQDGNAGAATSGGSGGAAPASKTRTPSAPGELVITEIMSNPASQSDTEGEWFEFYNPSTIQSLDLGGCTLDDGSSTVRTFPAAFVIAPQHYAVVARSAAVALAADLVISFSLGNETDSLALRCGGTEIDRVAYGPDFPRVAGASMALDPALTDARSNDEAAAWCAAVRSYGAELGSPGAQNPPCDGAVDEDGGAL